MPRAGPGGARFVSLLRWLGDRRPDPTLRIDRIRRVTPGGMSEQVEIASTASTAVHATVTLGLSCDFAPIEVVKSGGDTVPAPAEITGPGELSWGSDRIRVTVTGEGGQAEPGEPGATARLRWQVTLPPGGRIVLRWNAVIDDPEAVVVAPAHAVEWSRPRVVSADHRLTRLLEQSLDDLSSLRLAEASAPGDTFLAAGVPWYLTLFGRDSLWAARMLLPLGTELAAGTLRVLARRQGTRVDPRVGRGARQDHARAAAARRSPLEGHDLRLPPLTTAPSTPPRCGSACCTTRGAGACPRTRSAALLPHLEAALGWLARALRRRRRRLPRVHRHQRPRAGQPGLEGLRRRRAVPRRAPGRAADRAGEVQGYAYEAARDGAGAAGGVRPARRGRAGATTPTRWPSGSGPAFWVDGPHGRFPALALDGDKRPVDALTSNIGHLLGTGLLSGRGVGRWSPRLLAAPRWPAASGCARCRRSDGGFSPLSATTAARSGRTTPRS